MKLKSSIFDLLKTEYQHLGDFYPLALITGILCAVHTISPLTVACLTIIGTLLILFSKLRKAGIFILLIGLGYTLMTYREKSAETPVLKEPIQVDLMGFVEETHQMPFGKNLILSHIRFLNRYDLNASYKIKLFQDKNSAPLSNNSWVKLRAFIRPPFNKIGFTGYDEANDLKFKQIGAVGQVQEILEINDSQKPSLIDSIRNAIAHRIQETVSPEVAEVLIPLSIGEQSVVSQRTYDLFRSGGITHILSVSGFHLSLLAFFIFLIVRRLFAFSGRAEYISGKKIAALLALLGSIGYILISGMQVPAIRSLIMIVIVLGAVLFDRNAISVRSLSIAAFGILLIAPELVLNIGFQLSFMAVLVLVTLYPKLRPYIWPEKRLSLLNKFFRYIFSFIVIDFLISLATTPFIIYHFNRYALYSPIGNALMGTIISFWVMPLLFMGLILMPFGIDASFLRLSGIGTQYVIDLCDKIHTWPWAVTIFPSFNSTALCIMTLGILLICLMKTHFRWSGLCVFFIGILIACTSEKPDLMIGDFGQTVALRTDQGLSFIAKSDKDYTARYWLLQNGENPDKKLAPTHLPDSIFIKGYHISFQEETCPRADICFLPIPFSNGDRVYPLNEVGVRLIYLNQNQARIIHLNNRKNNQNIIKKRFR